MVNPFLFLSLGALIANSVLVLYILWKGPRGHTTTVFVLLLIVFTTWSLTEVVLRAFPALPHDTQFLLVRLGETAVSFIPGLLVHFVLAYPRPHPILSRPWGLLAIYAAPIIFAALVGGGDILIADVAPGPMGPSALPGALYIPIASLYVFIILAGWIYLGRSYLQETDRREVRRYLFLIAGFGIGVIGGTVTEIYGPFIFSMPTRLGLGTTYTTIFSALVAFAIFRYGFLAIEPAMEARSPGRGFAWAQGRNYIVLERARDTSFQAFRGLAQEVPGLVVTAFPPRLLSGTYALRKTPFLWLSSQRGELSLKPSHLEVDVLQTLLRFMRDNRHAAILLDDLEYLAQVNGFPAVLRTVSRTASTASKYECTLLANLNPSSMDGAQVSTLQGLFDEVQVGEEGGNGASPSWNAPGALLWEGSRDECLRRLAQNGSARKTVVSTLYPGKLRSTYGLENADFLWLAPAHHEEFPTYDPARLTLEVLRDVSRSLSEDSLVYIGELEVLIGEAGFLEVLEYAKQVVDAAVSRGALVVASVEQGALSPRLLSTLEKRFAATVS
ncbi:MAG: DUF835 domain-containing protein [Thermoplasmata archaeon]